MCQDIGTSRTLGSGGSDELRLRSITTSASRTATEIRDLVERMQGIVSILQSVSTEDRRRVYQAAQLSITYDHEGKRAKLHAPPDPGCGVPYVSEGRHKPQVHGVRCHDQSAGLACSSALLLVQWRG